MQLQVLFTFIPVVEHIVYHCSLKIVSINTSRVSGQGHRIVCVCLSVHTLTTEPFDLLP